VLGTLLFIIYINELCNDIYVSNYLRFADDIHIFRAIKTPHDFSLLQMDIDSIYGWCIANNMKTDISETIVIFFIRTTYIIRLSITLALA
jgi:hypothetical protein